MKFGDFLRQNEICSADYITTALGVMTYRKEKLGRTLVELGFLDAKSLDRALILFLKPDTELTYAELVAKRSKVPLQIQQEIEARVPGVLVIGSDDRKVTVVTREFSDSILKTAENISNKDVTLLRVRTSVFRLLEGKICENAKQESDIVLCGELSCDQKLLEDNPHTHLIKQCFEQACAEKASDVHFEPFANAYLIRFRVHGVLRDWKTVAADHTEALTNKLKWILNLDLAIVAKPQDSRASFESFAVDMRVNSMPTACSAEKIVLRIQYQEEKLSLTDIGLSDEKIAVLRRNIGKREGLIIISGPTGSGKTTTLYALLEEMDRLGKNISTLENPVEKSLERINQSNVTSKEDFYEFQRALMRQDPDVILLGEIRDPETADLSMKLASTGHLVLSTVHANGAREVVDRLLNLGVDEFIIHNNLRLSVAQRLVRKLCQSCRVPIGDKFKANPSGCSHCKSGISGRIAIIEYLEREHLDSQETPTTLRKECETLTKKGVIDANELQSM